MWPADKPLRQWTMRDWRSALAVYVCGLAGLVLALVVVDSFRIPQGTEKSSSAPITGQR